MQILYTHSIKIIRIGSPGKDEEEKILAPGFILHLSGLLGHFGGNKPKTRTIRFKIQDNTSLNNSKSITSVQVPDRW